MKIKFLPICLAAVLVLSACGREKANKPDSEIDNKVKSEAADSVEEVITDEKTASAQRQIVSSMLECFKNLDYEGAMEYIRESDRQLFALDNTSQKTLYDTLFAKLSYDFDSCFVRNGRTFVTTEITAPDMLDVYGELNLRYMDAMLNGEIASEEESRAFNNRVLGEIIAEGEIDEKTMEVEVELQPDADGEEKVVFTAEIMNAMLGDIQTAQQQVSSAIEEGLDEYNSAKDAGAFE